MKGKTKFTVGETYITTKENLNYMFVVKNVTDDRLYVEWYRTPGERVTKFHDRVQRFIEDGARPLTKLDRALL